MTRFVIEFHPAAVEEARGARVWFEERSPAAADAFLAELDRGVDHVLEEPEAWPPFLHGTRRYLLRRFPFQLVYRRSGDVVTVLAVAHGRRRPGYWRNRG